MNRTFWPFPHSIKYHSKWAGVQHPFGNALRDNALGQGRVTGHPGIWGQEK